jgi:hypothetical protein
MIADGVLIAYGVFGLSAFCFFAGFVSGSSKHEGASTFPITHVSFDPATVDADRLRLLDEARVAVLDGRLSQAKRFENDGTTDKASEPRDSLEN